VASSSGSRTAKDVRAAFTEMLGPRAPRQRLARASTASRSSTWPKQGTEVIIGATVDPQFGPVIMFGLGGVFVEVLKDVAFRVVPLDAR
jgi:acyl-CoA synthetase (NDP forming)